MKIQMAAAAPLPRRRSRWRRQRLPQLLLPHLRHARHRCRRHTLRQIQVLQRRRRPVTTGFSMYKTLEKYRSCNFNSQEVKAPLDSEINYHEYLKLKTRVEFLQTTQRNILGEDLGPLSNKELEQLENQIEMSLKQIRSRKNQMLLDQFFALKSKEQELQDLNKDLRKKLQETSGENVIHTSWEAGGHSGASGNANDQSYQGFLQHPENDSSMQIGYHPQAYMDQLNNQDMAAAHHPNEHGGSGWI